MGRRWRIPPGSTCVAALGHVLCAAAVALFVLSPADTRQRAEAAVDAAWLGLTVSAPHEIELGEPVTLQVKVTNQTGEPCMLAAAKEGTVELTVSHDGKQLFPTFGTVDYLDGYASVLKNASRTVAPGDSVVFGLTATPAFGEQFLSTVSVTPAGNAIAARWPIDKLGAYEVAVTYAMPGGKDSCAGTSSTAKVSFAVVKECTNLGGGAGMLVATAFLRRRRLRVIRTATVALCAALLVLISPTAANADVVADGDKDTEEFRTRVAGCLATIRANDPAGIMPYLDSNQWKVHIVGLAKGRSAAESWSVYTVLYWNVNDTEAYSDGVMPDACSTLYHELVHSFDHGHRNADPERCWGVEKKEIRATRAENEFRNREHRGLGLRGKYQGMPLPPAPPTPPDPVPPGTPMPWDYASINKQCREQPKPPPGTPGGPVRPDHGKCSNPSNARPRTARAATRNGSACSNGDPHITTFDKHRYDFQAVGEFVLSQADGIEVQARQSPMPKSRLVSANTAIGMRVGPDRLSFDMADGLRVLVNGAAKVIRGTPLSLPGGGTVVFDESGSYLVTWPDGTLADIEPMEPWGLILTLYPSDALKGKTRGILGNYDGHPDNDLVTAGGVVLPDPPSRKQLYQDFADSWRVTDATSLLPYPPGTNTASFTDKTFPDRMVTVADLDPAKRQAAQELCRSLGVTDRDALDDCVIDVVLSGGQPAFATAAATADQHVPDEEPGGGGVIPPGGTVGDGASGAGSITEPGRIDTYELDLGDSTVLRLAQVYGELGQSGRDTLRIKPVGPDGYDEPGFTYITRYQWKVKRGGTYKLQVWRDDGDTGGYSFVAIAAKERRGTLTIDQPITGQLEVRGRVNLYSFVAPSTGKLSVKDCSGDSHLRVGAVPDSPSPDVLRAREICDGEDFANVEAGEQYVLVVWSEEEQTGSYTLTPVISP